MTTSKSNATICYCSDITSEEIEQAVNHGCKSIKEVRDYLGKNITGKCKEMNPQGVCCHPVFEQEIKKYL